MPSLLAYQPPEAATLSEVGWSSIATGVWPAKHGVRGIFVNNDPGQATKNGYPDFLTRVEQVRPGLSTFLASNWANIGRHENGGPIFGDRIDARYALAAPGTIEGWDQADQEVTDVAARYLREGDPDAGFVYLGRGRRGGAPGRVANAALPAGHRGHRPPHRAAAHRDTRASQLPLGAVGGDRDHRPRPAGPRLPVQHQPRLRKRPGADLVRGGGGLRARPGTGLRRHPEWWTSRPRSSPAWACGSTPPGTSTGARSPARRPFPSPRSTAEARGRVLTIKVRAPAGAPGWSWHRSAAGGARSTLRPGETAGATRVGAASRSHRPAAESRRAGLRMGSQPAAVPAVPGCASRSPTHRDADHAYRSHAPLRARLRRGGDRRLLDRAVVMDEVGVLVAADHARRG